MKRALFLRALADILDRKARALERRAFELETDGKFVE